CEFGTHRKAPDGKQSWCRTCRSTSKRTHTQRNRDFLNAYKVACGCVDCGCRGPACVLDFDHLRGKKFTIGEGTAKRGKTLLREIMKCDVRCANCHRIKTEERKS